MSALFPPFMHKLITSQPVRCGAGDWSVEMAKRYTDVTFHAVDTVCSTPSSRQQRHFPKNVNVTAVRGGLDNLPFGDQSFDFVMCRFLSFRIQNWRSLIDEMIRLTKAGWYVKCFTILSERNGN
jgi:ubiquinone/menaquinone biosynthesis C-methylase UbiE